MNRGLIIALVASVLVLALAVAGLGAYVFFLQPVAAPAAESGKEKTKGTQETTVELEYLKLKSFVTDLADKDRPRYIDTSIALAFADKVSADAAKKLEPQIRDLILSQIRTRTAVELAGADGKEKLARSLQTSLAPLLKESLKAVFITDLVVQ